MSEEELNKLYEGLSDLEKAELNKAFSDLEEVMGGADNDVKQKRLFDLAKNLSVGECNNDTVTL
ncbi:MAG: hypothetical protein LBQ52_00745 [Helicobacteraceae bacterium]|jgi:hypothetical protein|nr:hypothetical protein [Helicobacteraceae bacterium]